MSEIVEIEHTSIEEGKRRVREVIEKKTNEVPSWKPTLSDGRWRAVIRSLRTLEGDRKWFTETALASINSQRTVGDQRDVYYSIRGSSPTKTVEIGGTNYPLKENKVYMLFTNDIMENIQLMSGVTMQSFGIRAGPRGFIFSQDGSIYVPRKRITYNLDGSPVLYFDLADDTSEYSGPSRKVIHFEKAAGFERVVSGDISKMIEAIFSTSQGQLSEAANKFLAERERRGMNIYSVHDSDPYGIQMMMLYGLASKNNAFMPTSFYAQGVTALGLLPRIARELELPPEDVAERGMEITNSNLRDMVKERPEFQGDYELLRDTHQQWEFQALNSLHEMAAQIYIVESLRARNDEIKHVPKDVKTPIVETVRRRVEEFVEQEIQSYVSGYISENVRPQLEEQVRTALASEIEAFRERIEEQLPNLGALTPEELREAVKKQLVERPTRYYDDAIRRVVEDILSQQFNITADVEFTTEVKSASTEQELTIGRPDIPEQPLTKNDIVGAIEERIIPSARERGSLVTRIRTAIEAVFDEPSLEW